MNTYDKGDRTRLEVQFRDPDGVATDPTTISVTVKVPGSAPKTYSYNLSPAVVVRSGAGLYHLDIDLLVPGTWRWKWYAGGSLVTAEESALFVRRSSV
jgi:hypothetical protein